MSMHLSLLTAAQKSLNDTIKSFNINQIRTELTKKDDSKVNLGYTDLINIIKETREMINRYDIYYKEKYIEYGDIIDRFKVELSKWNKTQVSFAIATGISGIILGGISSGLSVSMVTATDKDSKDKLIVASQVMTTVSSTITAAFAVPIPILSGYYNTYKTKMDGMYQTTNEPIRDYMYELDKMQKEVDKWRVDKNAEIPQDISKKVISLCNDKFSEQIDIINEELKKLQSNINRLKDDADYKL